MSTGDTPNPYATPEAPGTAAPVPEAPPGLVHRIIGTIVEPTRMFTAMRDNPRWLLVFLITLVIVSAVSWVTQPIQANETADLMAESKFMQRLPEEAREQALTQMRDTSTTARVKGLFGSLFAAIPLLIVAGVLWVGQRILGGTGRFKAALSAASHGAFIFMGLGSLARLPLVLQKQSVFEVTYSPAAFLDAPISSPTYRLLANLDVFSIWAVVVTGLGLAALCRIGKGKGIAVVVPVWLIFCGLIYVAQSFMFG